jgi:hypothetical protein
MTGRWIQDLDGTQVTGNPELIRAISRLMGTVESPNVGPLEFPEARFWIASSASIGPEWLQLVKTWTHGEETVLGSTTAHSERSPDAPEVTQIGFSVHAKSVKSLLGSRIRKQAF